MLPRRLFQAALLVIGTATFVSAASAQKEHTIIILQSSYFPSNLVVEPGDLIRFVNASGHKHTVTGEHNTWTTGTLPTGEETVFEVDPSMLGMFFGDEADTFQGTLSQGMQKPHN